MGVRWLGRPSLWTALIALAAYWHAPALHGPFIYDDVASLQMNVVVNGQVPWTEVMTRDFWGHPLQESRSHKSFRPLTTLTFRWNWILGSTPNVEEVDTYGFHVVNVSLHALVTGLVTEVAARVFLDSQYIGSLLTGLLFGLHPVHAEAVSNITSRGELLMSLFFLLAFLSLANYHPSRQQQQRFTTTLVFVYLLPWLCMTLSLFSKEQGATTLIALTIWDFLVHQTSVRDFGARLRQRESSAVCFLRRTMIYACQTILVVALRMWWNGESSPDFIYEQNPAGFSSDRFTRIFSVNWVYCLYLWDAVYPFRLAPDWSGVGIDLITTWRDPRIICVLLLWIFVLLCGVSLWRGGPRASNTRRILLTAFFAFTLSPFLLSSNLLVVTGLMKADRVIYLPLLGFCMIEVLIFQLRFVSPTTSATRKENDHGVSTSTGDATLLPKTRMKPVGYLLLLVQLFFFAQKVHERNVAWSDPLYLWWSAYQVNPRSHHTRFNAAYHLTKKYPSRQEEVEFLLRPVIDPFDGKPPTDSFLYAMTLRSLGRCEESLELVEEAFYAIEVMKQENRVRNTKESLARAESDLLIAKALCTEDFAIRGQLMYEACQVDPTNGYAIKMYSKALKQVQLMKQMMGGRSMHSIE
jgi:hypothetical protein